MPLSVYYPTLNEPQHQLIICNVGNPINLLIQCLYFLCNKRQKWICGLENFGIANGFGNVHGSYLFICHIMFGIQPFYRKLLDLFKKSSILKFIINPFPLGKLLVNISFGFLFLSSLPMTKTYKKMNQRINWSNAF
jgi:hypothetical protein